MAEAEYWRFTVARDCQKKKNGLNANLSGIWEKFSVLSGRRRKPCDSVGIYLGVTILSGQFFVVFSSVG